MLPTQIELQKTIKDIITKNDNAEDAEAAINEFSRKLAQELLKVFQKADVIIGPGAIQTTVTTSTGAGTGFNPAQVQGKLK
jgi:hypothetical protein